MRVGYRGMGTWYAAQAIIVAVASAAIFGDGLTATAQPIKPPCPSIADQKQAAGRKAASGTETPPAQPAERSGILPSAGSDGSSAAPTVQQNKEAMASPLDCPLAPTHPNALTSPPPEPKFSAPPPK